LRVVAVPGLPRAEPVAHAEFAALRSRQRLLAEGIRRKGERED